MFNLKKIAIAAALTSVLFLSGCAYHVGTDAPDNNSAPAPKPTTAVQSDPLLKGFGDTITYANGVSVSVSQPAPFTPTDAAAGVTPGQPTVVFNFKVTNNSKNTLSIFGYPNATSGGLPASSIVDLGINIGDTPLIDLLPTQSITWQEGFSVADPSNITIQYSPGMQYKNAIFDSNH